MKNKKITLNLKKKLLLLYNPIAATLIIIHSVILFLGVILKNCLNWILDKCQKKRNLGNLNWPKLEDCFLWGTFFILQKKLVNSLAL